MSKMKEWRFLFDMIRCSLTEDVPPMPDGMDWEALYRICKFHKIEALAAHGIEKLTEKETIPEEIRKKFEHAWQMETARDTTQHFALEELLESFEQAGVYCLPLKGIFLKHCYPQTDLRMMADLDILFKLEQEKEVEEILLKQGYHCHHRDEHHHIYYRKPFMNIEMHYCLFEEGNKFASYFRNPWKRAEAVDGKKYIYQYRWEDFYIFVIAHMAKHFENGGSGIRSIVDIWQFEKKWKSQMDWEYVETELSKIGLKDFLHHMEELVQIWFEEKEGDSFYDQLTELMIGSGVYGTMENYWAQNVAAADKNVRIGQMKIWLSTIFYPYSSMKLQYKYLEKYPILLPVAWGQRIFRACFRRKGRAKAVFAEQKTDFSKVRDIQGILDKLGL